MLVIKISSEHLPADIKVCKDSEGKDVILYSAKVTLDDVAFEVEDIYMPYTKFLENGETEEGFKKEAYYLIDVPQSTIGFINGIIGWQGAYIPNTFGAVESHGGYNDYDNNITAEFLLEAYNRGEFEKYEYIIEESLTHLMSTKRPAAGAWEKWGELLARVGKTATDYVPSQVVEKYLQILKVAPDLLAKSGRQLGEVENLEDEISKAQKKVEQEQKNISDTGTIFSVEFTDKVNTALVEKIKQLGGFQMEYKDHGHFDIEVDGKMYHGKLGDVEYSEYSDYDIDENTGNDEVNNPNSKYPKTHFFANIWQGDDYYEKGYYGESEAWRTGYFLVQLTPDTIQILEEFEKTGKIIHGVEEEHTVEEIGAGVAGLTTGEIEEVLDVVTGLDPNKENRDPNKENRDSD